MKTLRNLVGEAKRQTAVVFVSVFAVAYLMTLPSSSLWLNLPVALFVVVALRHLSLELDIRWKSRGLEAENLSVREAASRHRQSRSRGVFHGSKDSSRNKWREGVDSPAVEVAIEELTEDIVTRLWCLLRQSIWALRRLIGEVVELVLRPQDKQNRLVLSLARELLACAVVRPVVNLMNPIVIKSAHRVPYTGIQGQSSYRAAFEKHGVNAKVNTLTTSAPDGDPSLEMAELSVVEAENSNSQHSASAGTHVQARPVSNAEKPGGGFSNQKDLQETACQRRSGASKGWTRASDLTVQQRSQALASERLDAMWIKGRNYNKKEAQTVSPKVSQLVPIAGPIETEILETAEGPVAEGVQNQPYLPLAQETVKVTRPLRQISALRKLSGKSQSGSSSKNPVLLM